MAEQIFNIVIGIFLAGMFFVSRTFRRDTVDGDLLRSNGFPAILIIIGIALLIILIIKQFRNKAPLSGKIIDIGTKAGKAVVINIILLTVYISIINFTGYVLSTFLYAIGAGRTMGYKKYVFLLLFSAAVTVVFVILFGKIFYVPLPRGTGLFRELSYFIY